jgi:hypothetical protein
MAARRSAVPIGAVHIRVSLPVFADVSGLNPEHEFFKSHRTNW